TRSWTTPVLSKRTVRKIDGDYARNGTHAAGKGREECRQLETCSWHKLSLRCDAEICVANGEEQTSSDARRLLNQAFVTQSGHYRRPLANLYSTSIPIGPPVSPRSRRTSSRTAKRASSGSETYACPGEPAPCSIGSKYVAKEGRMKRCVSVVISTL